MLITQEITVPSGTSQSDPLVIAIEIPGGTVRQFYVGWRWGSADLCGMRIWHHENQVIPYSLSQWLPSFDQVLSIPADLDVWLQPHVLTIHAYNEDDTYAHTVWIGVSLDRQDWETTIYNAVLSALLAMNRAQFGGF